MGDLYIQKSEYRLSLNEHRLIIRNQESMIEREISLRLIDNLLIFGQAQLTTQLIKALAEQKINVFYFSGTGKFLAFLDSGREEDYEKQQKQAAFSLDQSCCLAIAKKIAAAKVRNQQHLLQAFDEGAVLDAQDFEVFAEALEMISAARSVTEMMGHEGRVAKSYFYLLNLLLPDEFRFYRRSRRPSKDPFNALLNFGYSLLHTCFIGMIRKNGLSLGFGVMHQPHRHHSVLASDLMEEWRPVIVDDTVMSLIRDGEIAAAHFEAGEEEGEVALTAEGIVEAPCFPRGYGNLGIINNQFGGQIG